MSGGVGAPDPFGTRASLTPATVRGEPVTFGLGQEPPTRCNKLPNQLGALAGRSLTKASVQGQTRSRGKAHGGVNRLDLQLRHLKCLGLTRS